MSKRLDPSARAGGPVRVVVLDETASGRRALSELLGRQADFEVSTAADLSEWERRRGEWDPQVLVMTAASPSEERIKFIETTMVEDPLPILLCGGEEDGDAVLRCLERGALSALPLPTTGTGDELSDAPVLLVGAVRRAAAAGLDYDALRRRPVSDGASTERWRSRPTRGPAPVIVVAAGEGGTVALQALLRSFPEDAPGVLVATRLPQSHTGAYARRLGAQCRMEVKEAVPNDTVRPGQVLIAPGNRHVLLAAGPRSPHVEIVEGPLVGGQRPSFDVLFRSASLAAGANALGVLLTGLGEDGPAGLAVLRAAGGRTAVQSPSSCLAAETPRMAADSGAAGDVLPLEGLAAWIMDNAASLGRSDAA